MTTRPRRRSICRIALATLGGAVLLAPLAGCGIIGGGGNRVVLVGDSLTVLTGDEVTAAVKDDFEVEVNASWGLRIDEELDDAAQAADSGPDQVVINIGTNNVLQRHDITASSEDLNAMLDLFEDARCIHIVTINEHIDRMGEDFGADAAALNDQIRELAGRRLNTDVIDWNQIVTEHLGDDIMSDDSVHPNPNGVKLLADAYAAALRNC